MKYGIVFAGTRCKVHTGTNCVTAAGMSGKLSQWEVFWILVQTALKGNVWAELQNAKIIAQTQLRGIDRLIQIPIVKIFSGEPPNLTPWVYFLIFKKNFLSMGQKKVPPWHSEKMEKKE